MSDVEEPPSKMSRYTDLQYLDECEDALDEGQEEWLSEGVLTDDDYNPASENQQSELNKETVSQDTTAEDIEDQVHETEASFIIKAETAVANEDLSHTKPNIEDQLNSLNAVKHENGVSDDLSTFLIRKSDGQVLDVVVGASDDARVDDKHAVIMKEEHVTEIKQDITKDDGNDTDDLLRMLGDDNGKKKKTLKMVKCEQIEEASSDDGDEFVFERSKMRTLRLAKHALQKKPATKAEPEETDDTDMSSDEVSTVKRIFGVQRSAGASAQGHIIQLNSHAPRAEVPVQKPVKHYTNKSLHQPKSILKSPATSVSVMKVVNKPMMSKSVVIKAPTSKTTATLKSGDIKSTTLKSGEAKSLAFKSMDVKTPSPFKPLEKLTFKSEAAVKSGREKIFKTEHMDDIIDEEFLEDDGLEVDELYSESEEEEDEGGEGEGGRGSQRIQRPERMDEDVLSDADSHTEDGSLYDELPSSDSDDMDDWFSIDIRAERAGDYLPLLGSKARSLLTAERGRVESRVATLRQSLAALTASARRQADQLRAAAMALAEIDDTLRAA